VIVFAKDEPKEFKKRKPAYTCSNEKSKYEQAFLYRQRHKVFDKKLSTIISKKQFSYRMK